MKIQSDLHGDMQNQAEMTWSAPPGVGNRVPKVGSPQQAEGAAPRDGDVVVRSRLFAGRPVYPPLLVESSTRQ